MAEIPAFVFHDYPANVYILALVILRKTPNVALLAGYSVVADQRISECQYLSPVAGVGHRLRITGHSRIENHFPVGIDLRAKGIAGEYRTVSENQRCHAIGECRLPGEAPQGEVGSARIREDT